MSDDGEYKYASDVDSDVDSDFESDDDVSQVHKKRKVSFKLNHTTPDAPLHPLPAGLAQIFEDTKKAYSADPPDPHRPPHDPRFPMTDIDLEIMKGIADSGVTKRGQPTLGGLFLPSPERVCKDLPKTSQEYVDAKAKSMMAFTECGLAAIRLEDNGLLWKPMDFDISRRRHAVFWKTHSDNANPGIIHSPPTREDFEHAFDAAKETYDMTLFVITSNGLWVLVSESRDFRNLSQEDEQIQELFNEDTAYTEFIQTKENFRKTYTQDQLPDNEFELVNAPNLARTLKNDFEGMKYFTLEFYAW